jgi:hypothetical protein
MNAMSRAEVVPPLFRSSSSQESFRQSRKIGLRDSKKACSFALRVRRRSSFFLLRGKINRRMVHLSRTTFSINFSDRLLPSMGITFLSGG